jgi:hypothetical protein
MTWGKRGSHSGSWWFHGKDGVAGSIPAGGSIHRLTSANGDESSSGVVAAGHIRSGMG